MYGNRDIYEILREYFESKIFVSICSYRDPECKHTIQDLFEKSKNPKRIHVGVCLQYDVGEHKDELNTKYKSQISEIHMDCRSAKGPCFARFLIQKYLFKNEPFYLQIDSHMRFEKDWDLKMIKILLQCEKMENGSKKCVLSTYPLGYGIIKYQFNTI